MKKDYSKLENPEVLGKLKDFYGEWVATMKFDSDEVVAHEKTASKLSKEVKKRGIKDPIFYYNMSPDVTYIPTIF